MSDHDGTRRRRLSGSERVLVGEALGWLVLVRVGLAAVPFNRLVSVFSLTLVAPDLAANSDTETEWCQVAERVAWAVRGAAARTPWSSSCLTQSLSGFAMLRRRGIRGTVYLGVGKDGAGDLNAHSWLVSGGRILTGAGERDAFSPIAAYQLRPVRS